jgi:glycolate oxidase iron-sulfur subunit
LLEETRGQLERRRPQGGATRGLGHLALNTLFPNRGLMHAAASVLRLGQRGALGALVDSARKRGWLPAFAARGLELTPPLAPRHERRLDRTEGWLPRGATLERRDGDLVFRPSRTPRVRVAFFTSCVMDVMFPHVNKSALAMLLVGGAEVHVPRAQTCCGALHAHAGLRHAAKDLVRRNVAAFQHASGGPFDYIVTDSAGCGAALRDGGHLLHDTPDATAAGEFAGRVRDISEVLATLEFPPSNYTLTSPWNPARPMRVAYHDPCHLAHAQKVRTQPRDLIRALTNVELVELPNADWCCGSAGVYNLTHPAMAQAQLDRKLESIEQADPDVVVVSNPGCLLHMQRGARARGSVGASMVHLVELLAVAYRGASA